MYPREFESRAFSLQRRRSATELWAHVGAPGVEPGFSPSQGDVVPFDHAPVPMGSPRFERGFGRPKRPVIAQATLRSPEPHRDTHPISSEVSFTGSNPDSVPFLGVTRVKGPTIYLGTISGLH